LHRDFAAFEGTFTSWAVSKEKDIQPAISAANKELRDLQAQLSQVKRVFIGVAAAATLGVAGALMFVPHLAVPLLAVSSLQGLH
jgi:cell division protein FtsL